MDGRSWRAARPDQCHAEALMSAEDARHRDPASSSRGGACRQRTATPRNAPRPWAPLFTAGVLATVFADSSAVAAAASSGGLRALGLASLGSAPPAALVAESVVDGLLDSSFPAEDIRRIVEAHRRQVRALSLPSATALRHDFKFMQSQAGAKVAVHDPAADLANSTAVINSWIGQAMWELDQKLVECSRQQTLLAQNIADAAEDTQELAAETSYMRTKLLQATGQYPEDKEYFNSLTDHERTEQRECQEDASSHVALEAAVNASQKRFAQIRALLVAECPQKASLLQEASVGGRGSDLVHDSGREAILQVLADAARASAAIAANVTSSGGIATRTSARLERRAASWASFLEVAESAGIKRRLRLSSSMPDKDAYCASMSDTLSSLAGEVEDDAMLLEEDRLAARRDCEEQASLERREMTRTAHKRADISTAMSQASARLGTLTARTRNRDEERRRLLEVSRTSRSRCKKEVGDLVHNKLCGLVQLRDQLWLSAGKTDLPQDCEVTDWEDGECSKSCGGGVQNSRRQVLLEGWQGAACPPLVMERKCNEEACPVHCQVGAWTGWSMCSAACDRGIQERTRVVTTQASHGGVPCPELVEMRSCTAEAACARDCELAAWTKWSHCSQACGGGTQTRFRHVSRPPAGLGVCPAEEDSKRMQRRRCNLHECRVPVDKFTCADLPVDIMLAVDSGGSTGQEGFDNLKKLALEVIKRSRPSRNGVRVGLLSFADDAQVVADISPKLGEVESKVQSGLKWHRGTSKLHTGLVRANSLLSQTAGARVGGGSSRGAPIVVVLTDGLIADPFLSTKAAMNYRRSGVRLLFSVFGGSALGDRRLFSKLASTPLEENTFFEPSMTSIAANLTRIAGLILRRACGAVSPPM
mmetsp:Transcript_37522/g.107842  ORF Transcript_37522/g.107842 Transcript_37522/m.107842 type:complete len:878 (-) Transcript_37522:66-2699(-)